MSNNSSGLLKRDPESLFLIGYNLMTLVSYHLGDMNPMYVLWAYYLQSLFIGARYLFLEVHQQIRTKKYQWFLALFFPIHYGAFHLAYFVFLLVMNGSSYDFDFLNFLKINLAILSTQFLVFIVRELSEDSPDHSPVFFFAPYVRIIPMHLIIIMGFHSNLGIYSFDLFILLKTLMDWISYGWFDRKETTFK